LSPIRSYGSWNSQTGGWTSRKEAKGAQEGPSGLNLLRSDGNHERQLKMPQGEFENNSRKPKDLVRKLA
jgi:hypothetical protein